MNYSDWIGRSPISVRKEAIKLGGWEKVFPNTTKFPVWASRVRNYFNVRPRQLTQLGTRARGKAKSRLSMTPNSLFDKGVFKGTFSLSGDVYEDEERKLWFEMSTVATIYHFPGKVNAWKKWSYLAGTQKTTPVFKLISPDSTGGSLELCIHNWQHKGAKQRGEIGPVGKPINLRGIVVINEQYQGSYNYSDNGVAGPEAHDHRDVQPHSTDSGFYLPVSFDINTRTFPENDLKGRPIANSDEYF